MIALRDVAEAHVRALNHNAAGAVEVFDPRDLLQARTSVSPFRLR